VADLTSAQRGAKASKGAADAEQSPHRRIVVKAGTSLLTGGTERLDTVAIASLVEQISDLHRGGVELLLVTSGAVAAGREALDRKGVGTGVAPAGSAPWSWELPYRQVLAAVGQSRLMYIYEQLFEQKDIPVAQALVTRRDIADRVGYLNIRNTLLALLALGVVPILNENDVVEVEELEGEVIGDNDTLSALVANIVDADLLVMLGDTAGLYTADPHVDPEARLIPTVERIDEVIGQAGGSWSGMGRGGMVAKLAAARLATTSGVATVIADGREPNVLTRLAGGETLGTWFPPAATRLESRQRWMLSAVSQSSAVVVDGGAVSALRSQKRSLLPAGVREVRGNFLRGDVVPILGPQDERVAAGVANYGAEDTRRIMGLRSDRIGGVLGYEYGAELVHRSNLVLL
jgi:glutamate 5-kinase